MSESALSVWSTKNTACAAQVERLFSVFSRYTRPGTVFCGFCHTTEEVQRFTETPLEYLDDEAARKLLWEPADHWESADVYRHFLPRVLQCLGPPWCIDDLYPTHLFETLLALEFRQWPTDEQSAIIEFLECLAPHLRLDGEDSFFLEWSAGLATLKDPELSLPPPSIDSLGDA
jgi:hypothetical protein